MKIVTTLLSVVVLAACAATGGPSRGAPSDRSTTTISMPASSHGASVARPIQLTTSADAGPVSVNVDLSAQELWDALPAAYQIVGIEVGTLDQENRVIGNRRLRVSRRLGGEPLSRYFRCGDTAFGAPQADQNPVELSVLTTVVPDGDQSRMETTVHAVVINAANGGARVSCSSTGALERALADSFIVR